MARKLFIAIMTLIITTIMIVVTHAANGKNVTPGDIDANGKVTASDARHVLRVAAQLETLTDEQMLSADANNDGFVTATDARLIIRVAAGIDSFPEIESDTECDSEVDSEIESEIVTDVETTTAAVKEPEATTAKPEATTEKAESTTKKPEATTKKPEATTKKPEATTKKPETTTKKPETTTAAPVVPGYLRDIKVSSPSDDDKHDSSIQMMASNYVYYLFLPSNMDRGELVFDFNSDSNIVKINGKNITSGEKTNILKNQDSFKLSINDSNYDVKIMQSENIPAIHITTESKNMDKIHADKEFKESGEMVMVNADGTTEYSNTIDYIKGRGNSSWKYAKKGYNIKLSKSTDLCELGKTKKWSLIPNHIDKSLLRNQVLYNLAGAIGLEYSPACTPVDLYLNGSYNGTYLLVVKTEIDKASVNITDLEGATEDVNEKDLDAYPVGKVSSDSRLLSYKFVNIPNNPDDITGGYLIELDHSSYNREISGFTTAKNQRVVVKSPEYASREQVEYIANWYQDFEEAVYSADGYNSKGKYYTEYIDVESFAKYYLLSEIAMNGDTHITSVFMYKESEIDGDGLLHAGPVWDFDSSLGNNGGTKSFSVKVKLTNAYQQYMSISKIYKNLSEDFVYCALFKHSDFRTLLADIYKETVADAYDKLLTEDFSGYVSDITASAAMNFKRWNIMSSAITGTQTGTTYEANISNLFNFLSNKKDFMDKTIDAYYEDYLYIFIENNNIFGVTSFDDKTIELFSGEAEIGDTVSHGGTTFTVASIKSETEPETPDVTPVEPDS